MSNRSKDRQTLRRFFDEKANDGEGNPIFVANILAKKGYLEILPTGIFRITDAGQALLEEKP